MKLLTRGSRSRSLKQRSCHSLGNVSLAVFALSTLLSSVAWAGPCIEVARTYCVAGTSTPLDWDWSIATPAAPFYQQSTVLAATNALLSAGDPATDIVQVFVSDFNANGYPSAVVNGSDPACFDINACELYIASVVLPLTVVPLTPATLTFNPTITLASFGAVVPSMTQLGMVAMVGLIGIAAVRATRTKSA
jgi:hypothetical protein